MITKATINHAIWLLGIQMKICHLCSFMYTVYMILIQQYNRMFVIFTPYKNYNLHTKFRKIIPTIHTSLILRNLSVAESIHIKSNCTTQLVSCIFKPRVCWLQLMYTRFFEIALSDMCVCTCVCLGAGVCACTHACVCVHV